MSQHMIDCACPLSESEIINFINHGVSVFGRYLYNGWKGLYNPEKDNIIKHGGKIVSIYEGGGNRITYFTYAQGLSDARIASGIAGQLGMPHGKPIFFAVDTETTSVQDMDKVRAYFQGLYDAKIPFSIGVYGSEFTCDNVHADVYMQTFAWSYGKKSNRAIIYQYTNDVQELGHGVDDDIVASTSVCWPDAEVHVPIVVSHPILKLTTPYTSSSDVKILQQDLNKHGITCTVDGVFGSGTESDVKRFQTSVGLASDGVVGPATWAKLDS